jgi:TRAP-type transport system small permease protein
LETVQKYFEKFEVIFLRLSQAAVLIMMILTSFDALSRYFFRNPITGAYEIIERYLMLMLVFLSISYVQRHDGHIRLDILFERYPKHVQDILNSIYYFLTAFLMFFIGYEGMIITANAFSNNLLTTGLINFPLWLSYIWIPIGAFLFMIRLIIMALSTARFRKEKNQS